MALLRLSCATDVKFLILTQVSPVALVFTLRAVRRHHSCILFWNFKMMRCNNRCIRFLFLRDAMILFLIIRNRVGGTFLAVLIWDRLNHAPKSLTIPICSLCFVLFLFSTKLIFGLNLIHFGQAEVHFFAGALAARWKMSDAFIYFLQLLIHG